MNGYPPGLGPNDPTAPDQASTDHTGATFTVKEGGGGEPMIMIEEYGPGLPILKYGDAFLMLHARERVPLQEIEDLANRMRRLLRGLSYTKFNT